MSDNADKFMTPKQFDRRWEELKTYSRTRPRRAFCYCLLIILPFVVPMIGWVSKWSEASELKTKLNEKSSDFSNLQIRYDNLQTTVAPIIRQAAKEFPGEEINESLKKIARKLEESKISAQKLADLKFVATVEVDGKDLPPQNAVVSGVWYAIALGQQSTGLVVASSLVFNQVTEKEGIEVCVYRPENVFLDEAVKGKPIASLTNAEYAQLELRHIPRGSSVLRGELEIILNGILRVSIPIPKQKTDGQHRIFIQDLSPLYKELREN